MASWVSARNLMTTATVLGTHADVAGFPKTNILQPERPYKTVRTPALGVQDIKLDLSPSGGAISYDYIVVVNKNYPQFECHISPDVTFATGTTVHGGTVVATRCPWNTRYMHVFQFTSMRTERYMVYRINTTPLDGAAYYSTGGLWLGTFENLETTLGRSWRWAYTFGPNYPELKIGPTHQGWSRTVRRSNPRATLSATLIPDVSKESPGGGDGLQAWLDLQRRIRENYFCALIEDWSPSHALICEDLSLPPVVDYPVAQIDLRFEEAV